MPCNSCPPSICFYELGSVDPCGNITLPVTADSAGDYLLKLMFNGSQVEITAAQAFDEDIIFPATGLNEHFVFIGQVFDESGDVVKVKGKEWIKFATQKTYELI